MSSKPPFAVLFDLDGVLIDTEDAIAQVRADLAPHYGFTPEEMSTRSWRGRSLRDFYDAMQELRPFDADFETFADSVLEGFFAYLDEHKRPTDPKLLAFLQVLKEHGVPIAVGTSALKRSAARKLAAVELHNHFEVVVTANDVEKHKPHPDVYIKAAELLGMTPSKCIVIEDAEDGIKAGHAAGMKTVGYSKFVDDVSILREADLVVNDFSKLSYQKLKKLIG